MLPGAPVPGLGTPALVAAGLLFPLVSTERLAGQPRQHSYSRWSGWALTVALAMLGISTQLLMMFIYGTVAYT